MRGDKLHQPFAVATHVALHFSERGQLLAFGLGDVEHVHRAESEQGGHGAFGIFAQLRVVLGAPLADHGSQNENAFFPAFDEAAKRVPGANPGHIAGVGFLSGNQHHIAEGVGMESGHGSEVLSEHLAMPGLQRLDEVIDCVFGFGLDVF